MTKLKATFDLIDGWRKANPDQKKFSWEGTTGNERRKIFSRIDRIYVSKRTWELTNDFKVTNCDISDHDGVTVFVRDPAAPAVGGGEPRLNLDIINHTLFKNEADRLIARLERQIKRYEKLEKPKLKPGKERALLRLRDIGNPQKFWLEYKNGLLRASELATHTRRKELTEIRRQAEREINKAEK